MLIAISAIVVHALAPPQAPSLSGGGRRPCGGLAKADAQNLTAHSKEDWAAHMYGWAVGELAGRRLPASPEQLEEEERDNAYDKAGFLSFMGYGGVDLRQVEVEY